MTRAKKTAADPCKDCQHDQKYHSQRDGFCHVSGCTRCRA